MYNVLAVWYIRYWEIYINDVRFVQDFHLPGTLVPSATKVIAVIESFMWLKHPKWEAKSPITAVRTPIAKIDITNVGQPLQWSFQIKYYFGFFEGLSKRR